MSIRSNGSTAGLSIVLMSGLTAAVLAQQNPSEEERLKKLDAGPKTIDVSKYPPEQQQAYKLFQAKCSTCHALARDVNTRMVLPGDWEHHVKRTMYKPNASISNDEGRALYRFMVYDASIRKTELLRKALLALAPADRAAAVEKIKAVSAAFTVP